MKIHLTAVILLLFLSPLSRGHAELFGVSGTPDPATDVVESAGEPGAVSVSLAHGFPLWFEDVNRLKLQLCLDKDVQTVSGSISPCLTEEFFPGAPISFPGNFGSEAFWWSALAFGSFTSTVGAGDALLVLAQEAGFTNEVTADGEQVAFGRIRIRVNVPISGTYRVTHPYGERDYFVTTVTAGREINQTQDIGNFLQPGPPPEGNFLLALMDGLHPENIDFPADFPAENAGLVSEEPAGIGPYLVAADAPGGSPLDFLQSLDGELFLADPGTEETPRTVPVTGSVFIPEGEIEPANFFRIRLLDPPDGFFLNAATASQEILIDRFQLTGKVFNDGPNTAPAATADFAATAGGAPVSIDILANDEDVIGGGNIHGIHPQALGLPVGPPEDPLSKILITKNLITANGGTVRRSTVTSTGKTVFLYVPAAGFTGIDHFEYVVQDTGGLISKPAAVEVMVEDLQIDRADYRTRTGTWHVSGTSSETGENRMSIHGGPRARLEGIRGGESTGSLVLRLAEEGIPFILTVDPLPPSEVTEANIFLETPEGADPVIFNLFFDLFDGDFNGGFKRTLSPFELQLRPEEGISTYADALKAIRTGRTYMRIHTSAFPDGELEGRITEARIGETAVNGEGRWEFRGGAPVVPGMHLGVSVKSTRGVQTYDAPLRIR